MKTTHALLVTTLALASASSALAQEADSSPAADLSLRGSDPTVEIAPSAPSSSERDSSKYPRPGTPLTKPSPAATSSPSPSPSPVKTSSPVKAPKAEKEPSPAKAASPGKAASPAKAPSPAKAASPAPMAAATPIPKGGVATAIKAMESRWAAAIGTHDASVPQELVAPDYIGVNSSGRVVNKATLLAGMKADKNTYASATNSGMTVRVLGNTAVAVGTTKQVGKDSAGKAFSYTYRWTDTWLERNGKWQCIASQSIAVAR